MMRAPLLRICSAAALVAGSLGAVSGRGSSPEDTADLAALREKVLNEKSFQDKVVDLCKKSSGVSADGTPSAECRAKVTDALFCRLLARARPDTAPAACLADTSKPQPQPEAAASAPSAGSGTTSDALVGKGNASEEIAGNATVGSLAAMKTRIMKSADFQREAAHMSAMMGCSAVRKSDACASYVQEAAFCLTFADQLARFSKLSGAREEKTKCAHIDEKLPQLALLMESKGRPSFLARREQKTPSSRSSLAQVHAHVGQQAAESPKSEVEAKANASTSTLAEVKAKIIASAGFQEQAGRIASMLGCGVVKKKEACRSYVQEVAFCLAYSEKLNKFASLPGYRKQTDECKSIDKETPQLAMFLQSKARGFVSAAAAAADGKSGFDLPPSFLQLAGRRGLRGPEDELAKEMTHDLEMNFNKIAPFGKEDTAKELQDHAAKTQDTLVDAVENAEVAEIKRAVFRALTRLRAATIKEFDTIARLETQAIDAYNDAHHYRSENPLAHLHEDEAPVETDKLKSFH